MTTPCTIVKVETWACSLPLEPPLSFGSYALRAREYAAVRLHSDDGLTAECVALSRRGPTDMAILDVLAPAVLGAEPRDVEAVEQRLLGASYLVGTDGLMARGRSLLEICVRDLDAQQRNLPLWAAMGGRDNILPVLMAEGYALPDESDEEFVARLGDRAGEGYSMIKLEAASYDDAQQLHRRLTALRERLGSDVELVVDFAWSLSGIDAALQATRGWQDLGIAWVEDPFDRVRVEEIAEFRRRSGLNVGVGDDATRPADLVSLLERDAVDVLRLDVTAIGGIGVAQELARLAEHKAVRVSLHIHSEIHEHCARCFASCDHVEVLPQDRPFDRVHELLQKTTLDRVTGGTARVPTTPGTGMRLSDHAVARHAYRHGIAERGSAPRVINARGVATDRINLTDAWQEGP